MKNLQNTLLVLSLFLNISLAKADSVPPALPSFPPLPLPNQNSTPSTETKQIADQDKSNLLLGAANAFGKSPNSEPTALDITKNPKESTANLHKTIESLKELNHGKRNDIKKFLNTNYKTEYLPSEIFNKSNPHLKKPLYMTEIVNWAFAAVETGNIDNLRILLENYPFLFTIKNDDGYGLLSYAILHSRNDIAYMLAYRGANLNEKNKFNAEPINIAARINNIEAVKLLLNNGCNGSYKDGFGKSALDYSLMNNNTELHLYITEFQSPTTIKPN